MKELTPRQRLLRVFHGKDIDRVPVSPFIYENFVREFKKSKHIDPARDYVEVYRFFGFDIMHRHGLYWGFEHLYDSDDWKVVKDKVTTREGETITTRIKTPVKELSSTIKCSWISKYSYVGANTEWFIKDHQDLEIFLKYEPELPAAVDFPEQKRIAGAVGDFGITTPVVLSVFNAAAEYRKLDDLYIDMLTEPEFYETLMTYILKKQKDILTRGLKEGIDVVHYGGNIASGSSVGPDIFRNHIFKYEKELIDFIQDHNIPVLYHNCGDAKSMYEVYNDLGVKGFESFTEPPFADNNLTDVLSRINKEIVLVGNVDQIDFLRKSTPEQIKCKVRQLAGIAKERGNFIIGTSDFFEEETPYENIFAFMEAGLEYGKL